MPQKVLKRKTSRRYKSRKSIEKDFDLYKFKDQMSKEMSRFKNKIANPSSQPIVSDYDKKYKQYITEGFTMSTLMIVNRMFSDSKSLPRDLRNNYPLHSLLIKIIRQLMMNELELVYFSIYLDIFGWKNKNFDIMDHFLITGLSVKKYLNINTEYLETYLNNEYPDLLDKFNQWLKTEKDYNLLITISPRDVNERFNLLKRPFNTYCKNNFIDYNESVDRILHMSLPYNENVKHGANEKTFHPLDEFEPKPKNIKIPLTKKGDKEKGKEEPKKKYVSFKVEKNAMLPPPVPINKSYSNLNLAARNSNLNFGKSINHGGINTSTLLFPQTSNSNLNLALGQQSTLSNVNVNYNQILNFTNTASVGNFNNTNSNFVNGNDLMKQQSELNFNDGAMLLGRTASGFDHSLMPRTSQPFLDGNDDALQECFFRPMELKHNLSLTSIAGDFKGEPSIFNLGLNKMYSNTPSTFKPMMSNTNVGNVNRNNIKEDDTNNNNINSNTIGNMTLHSNPVNNGKDNYNLFKSLNTTTTGNTINNMSQTSYSLRQGQNNQGTKKNLLMMYQKMANEKK